MSMKAVESGAACFPVCLGDTMTISITLQSLNFLQAVLLGVVLGVLYDGFRSIRMVFRTGWIINLLMDLLFWAVATAAFCIFVLTAARGNCRLYLLVGMALGILFYQLTVSILVQQIWKGGFSILNFIFKKITLLGENAKKKIILPIFSKKELKNEKKLFKFFTKRFKIK